MELPELCKDLMFEIVARLPTAAVIRFSSVSKAWQETLKGKDFIEHHSALLSPNHSPLFLTSQAIDDENSAIIFCIRDGHEAKKNDPTIYRYVLPYRASNPNRWDSDRDFYFSCACKGLVCIAPEDHRKPVVVCNPHALQCISVPPCTVENLLSCSIGLGYGISTKKYKLVCLTYRHDFNFLRPEANPGKMMVFTLGGVSNMWREVRDALFYPRKGPLYADGKIFWVVDLGILRPSPCLLSFDVESEESTMIKNISSLLTLNIHNGLQLAELEGRVSVAFHNNYTMEIWMPTTKRDCSHWERRHKIRILPPPMERNFNLPWVIGIWERNQHLMIWFQDRIMAYKYEYEKHNSFRQYEGPRLGFLDTQVWQLCSTYTTSMVSLRRYDCSTPAGVRAVSSTQGIKSPPKIFFPATTDKTETTSSKRKNRNYKQQAKKGNEKD